MIATVDEAAEAGFHAALDAQIGDDTTRLVFADWLEERGDPRALGYRLLAKFQMRPHCSKTWNGAEAWGAWSWGSTDTGRPYKSNLKTYWHNQLTKISRPSEVGPPGRLYPDARYFTRQAAEDDAAMAVARLSAFNLNSLVREARL